MDEAIRMLRGELARINHVIRLFESLAEGRSRRGRPPKLPAKPAPSSGRGQPKKRKRPRKAAG
jgi:hypothetical protein